MTEKKLVVAIKLPFDLQERILAFPFLHLLNERLSDAEYHFITPKHRVEVLNLLPFRAFYHEFDENEIASIFDVHRFAVNSKIYNVDLFISLTNSFPDACLGLGLNAKKRLGFSNGWKTLVLNMKAQRPMGHHVCEDFFSLLKVYLGADVDTRIKVMSRELPPVIENWDSLPYIALDLSPVRSADVGDEWVELVSQFENQRFIFFSSEDQEKTQLLIEAFFSKLPKKNIYEFYIHKNWIELSKMMAYAKGVMAYNGPAASMSAYVGSKTLILFDREDPQRYAPLYFLADIVIQKSDVEGGGDLIKSRKTFDMGVVADKAHEFFRL